MLLLIKTKSYCIQNFVHHASIAYFVIHLQTLVATTQILDVHQFTSKILLIILIPYQLLSLPFKRGSSPFLELFLVNLSSSSPSSSPVLDFYQMSFHCATHNSFIAYQAVFFIKHLVRRFHFRHAHPQNHQIHLLTAKNHFTWVL